MATQLVPLEKDVQRAVIDLLDADGTPWCRMNAGDRFGVTNGKKWRIRGHATGTADLLAFPKITRHFPFGPYRLMGVNGSVISVPVPLWLEIKRPGKKQSPEQVRFELECIQRGHGYLLVDDVSKLSDWLREHRG